MIYSEFLRGLLVSSYNLTFLPSMTQHHSESAARIYWAQITNSFRFTLPCCYFKVSIVRRKNGPEQMSRNHKTLQRTKINNNWWILDAKIYEKSIVCFAWAFRIYIEHFQSSIADRFYLWLINVQQMSNLNDHWANFEFKLHCY